jgi:hypothetical protein
MEKYMSQLTDEEFEWAKAQIAQLIENDLKHDSKHLYSFSEEDLKRIRKAFKRIEKEDTESNSKFYQFLCSGLIAVDFLFIQGYLSTKLDLPETLALYAFAISLPLLVLYLLLSSLFSHEAFNYDSERKMLFTSFSTAMISIANYAGIALSFFHFSLDIGTWFVFSSFIALLILAFVYIPVHRK